MATNSRHLLDQELVAVLGQLPVTPVNQEALVEIRANGAQQIETLRPMLPEFPGIEVSESPISRNGFITALKRTLARAS